MSSKFRQAIFSLIDLAAGFYLFRANSNLQWEIFQYGWFQPHQVAREDRKGIQGALSIIVLFQYRLLDTMQTEPEKDMH